MESCVTCGREHRTKEAVERCAARGERKAAREAKKEIDRLRRIENWRDEPPKDYIRQRRREGVNWDRIVSGLRRDYPPLEFEDQWDLWQVVYLDSERLRWGRTDTETITLLRLEKYMLGDWGSVHPMQLVELPPGILPVSVFNEIPSLQDREEE